MQNDWIKIMHKLKNILTSKIYSRNKIIESLKIYFHINITLTIKSKQENLLAEIHAEKLSTKNS